MNNKKQPINKKAIDELEELNSYVKSGIDLRLGGKPSNPSKIVKACSVAESKGYYSYMRDYLPDEKGVVQKINFNKIKLK